MSSDTQQRYGTLSRCLHWGMAFFITWQFLKFFDRINDGEHWVGQNLVSWHLSIGTLLLVLVVLRLIWAGVNRGHRPASYSFLARLGHFLLYACMVLMPVTGVWIMIGNGYGLTAFGIELAARGDAIPWMATLGGIHSALAWLFLILSAGHIVMALYHHFIKRDGLLNRVL